MVLIFNEELDYEELNKYKEEYTKCLEKNINEENAIRWIVDARFALKENLIQNDDEIKKFNNLIEKHKEMKENNTFKLPLDEITASYYKLFMAEVNRLHFGDCKLSDKYIKEIVQDMNFLNDVKVSKTKATEFYYGSGNEEVLIKSKILIRDFENDYFPVSHDLTLLANKARPIVLVEHVNIKKFFYTCIASAEANINLYGSCDLIYRYYLHMYYGIYRYVHEPENRDELKKHILNNAYKLYSQTYLKFVWGLTFSSLAYAYPEIFEGFTDNEYKLQKTTLVLIDFLKVDPINGFTEAEVKLLKNFKKEKNTLLNPKPKKLKMIDDFREDLVAIHHNSKENLNFLEKELIDFSYEGTYEEEKCKLNLLKEICATYNKLIWTGITVYSDKFIEKCLEKYLEDYCKVIEIYEKLIFIVEEKELISLGKAYYNLALCYEYFKKEDIAKKYFEKAAVYLPGCLLENYDQQPVDDIDNSALNHIRNLYANFKLGNSNEIYSPIIDDAYIDEYEEMLEEIDLNEYDYTFVSKSKTKDAIKLIRLILKIEKAKGLGVSENTILFNIIKEILAYEKTGDSFKKEKIKKALDKLYNSISNHLVYMEYYPIYLDVYNYIEKL